MPNRIRCPNYAICSRFYTLKESEDLICIPIRDPVTNLYTTLSVNNELPVCWECHASYNEGVDEDDQENKYLSFIDSIECCICLKIEPGVSFPNCMHYTCIPCHYRCWFGPTPIELKFPYCDSIKELYNNDHNNEIWIKDPKIQEYIKEGRRIETERMNQWEIETNLRKCPLCRM